MYMFGQATAPGVDALNAASGTISSVGTQAANLILASKGINPNPQAPVESPKSDNTALIAVGVIAVLGGLAVLIMKSAGSKSSRRRKRK